MYGWFDALRMTGQELRDRRTSACISGAAIARRLGRHRAAVTRLEQRGSVPQALVSRYLSALADEVACRRAVVVEAGHALIADGEQLLQVAGL